MGSTQPAGLSYLNPLPFALMLQDQGQCDLVMYLLGSFLHRTLHPLRLVAVTPKHPPLPLMLRAGSGPVRPVHVPAGIFHLT